MCVVVCVCSSVCSSVCVRVGEKDCVCVCTCDCGWVRVGERIWGRGMFVKVGLFSVTSASVSQSEEYKRPFPVNSSVV